MSTVESLNCSHLYIHGKDLLRPCPFFAANVLDRVKPWLVPQRRPKDAIKLAKALEACK